MAEDPGLGLLEGVLEQDQAGFSGCIATALSQLFFKVLPDVLQVDVLFLHHRQFF